jgi:hypothetical protein
LNKEFVRPNFDTVSTHCLVIELTRKQRISLAALVICSLGAATAFSIAPESWPSFMPRGAGRC